MLGNSFGEFGISKNGDISSVDDGYSGSDKLTFFYRISNQTLMISVRWPDKQEKQIAVFNTATYRPGDSYWARRLLKIMKMYTSISEAIIRVPVILNNYQPQARTVCGKAVR